MHRNQRATSMRVEDEHGYTGCAQAGPGTAPGHQGPSRRRLCLLHRQRTLIGALPPIIRLVTSSLRRPIGARIIVAAVVVAIALMAAQQGISQAAPPLRPAPLASILPTNVGVGIPSTHAVTLGFAEPMDRASVADGLLLAPQALVTLQWSADGRSLSIAPISRWQTDQRYLLALPASTRLAGGSLLAAPLRFSF